MSRFRLFSVFCGEHPKVVAERLGHSSTAFTLDVYSHVATTMQENASAKIANEMYGKLKSHSRLEFLIFHNLLIFLSHYPFQTDV